MFEHQPVRPGSDPAASKRQLAAELTQALIQAEKRSGRVMDREELSRRINVSVASLYAYLNGTTLPPSAVLDSLLDALGITGRAVGRLSTLRDAIDVAQRLRRAKRPPNPGSDSPPPAQLPCPRQLPPAVPQFVGRTEELRLLDKMLDRQGPPADGAGAAAQTALVTVISGTAGCGKTALALHWAYLVKERFPDGQLHLDLRGFGQRTPVAPDDALRGVLEALGVAPAAVPGGLDGKAALFRSLLAERRFLLLIDDARSSDHVRRLLPGSPTCLVIVTSRLRLDSLTVLQGARQVHLDRLPHSDAWDLLESRIGPRRMNANPWSAAELVDLSARLPLALSLTAARVAGRPDEPLDALAEELRDRAARLDLLIPVEGNPNLRRVFRCSYDQLPEQESRLFRLLGTHPGPTIDAYACAALLGTTARPRPLLDGLKAAHLIDEPVPGRFAFHDLLRIFAGELSDLAHCEEERAGVRRMLDFYLSGAAAASSHLRASTTYLGPLEKASLNLSPIDSYEQAMSWFTEEIDVLEAVIARAIGQGFESRAWRLAWSCAVFLRRSGRPEQRVRFQRMALDAATRAHDRAAIATSLRLLADGHAALGDLTTATGLLHASLADFLVLDDEAGQLHTHLSLVRICRVQGLHREGLDHARQALSLAERGDDVANLADGLTAAARQLASVGTLHASLEHSKRARILYRRLGHVEGEADILGNIGDVFHALGQDEEAAEAYERSIEADRRLGDRYWEARTLEKLANLHLAQRDMKGWCSNLALALKLLESLRHPYADVVREALDGGAS